MITFKKIKWKNFLSTGNQFIEMDFQKHHTNLIIGTQVDVVVTYHLSESDAIININELPNNYTNIANPQTIYARLTDFNTECFNVSEFQLDINFGPDYTAPTDFIICDDNADVAV